MPNSVRTELQGELKIPVTDQEEKEFEAAGRKEDCLLNENTAQEIL